MERFDAQGCMPPYEQQIDHGAEVARGGLPTDSQARGQACRVEQLTLVMRQHLPEAMKRLGRHARPEGRKVPFQVGLNECESPLEAGGVVPGQVAVGKPTARPEPVNGIGRECCDLSGREWRQFEVRNSARQTLSRLLEQLNRGRTEKQELPGAIPSAAPAIDEAPEGLRDPRCAVNLVENHQLILVRRQIEFGVGELDAVGRQFQVQVHRLSGEFVGKRPREGGLASLARSEQSHGREAVEQLAEPGGSQARDHILQLCHNVEELQG